MTTTAEEPPYRIRKFGGTWLLTKKESIQGFVVDSVIGLFRSHAAAIAVMDLDMQGDIVMQTFEEGNIYE